MSSWSTESLIQMWLVAQGPLANKAFERYLDICRTLGSWHVEVDGKGEQQRPLLGPSWALPGLTLTPPLPHDGQSIIACSLVIFPRAPLSRPSLLRLARGSQNYESYRHVKTNELIIAC